MTENHLVLSREAIIRITRFSGRRQPRGVRRQRRNGGICAFPPAVFLAYAAKPGYRPACFSWPCAWASSAGGCGQDYDRSRVVSAPPA